jgi:hypothetical protein
MEILAEENDTPSLTFVNSSGRRVSAMA